jgi:hypothetical protein
VTAEAPELVERLLEAFDRVDCPRARRRTGSERSALRRSRRREDDPGRIEAVP